jgi:Uma2 family endonuclease
MYNRGMAAQDDVNQPAAPYRKLTYRDYVRFPDDGRRHELIDGEHYVTPSPILRHQKISGRLEFALQSYVRERGMGHVFHAPLDVILSDSDVVDPDILYVSEERAAILQDWVRGAPDLVVEILSPATRKTDESVKRHLYDRVGVREYWIVDPELELVKVHRREENGSFPRVAEISRETRDELTSPLLPGFMLPLDELFG